MEPIDVFQVVHHHGDPHEQLIELRGEFDLDGEALFRRVLGEALARRSERLVLDLGAVTFLGSAGIRGLVAARHAHPDLELRAVPPHVATVLSLCGLDEVFETGAPGAQADTEVGSGPKETSFR